jgi:hypothetical protein
MDGFVLTMVLGLTALSVLPPEWDKNKKSAWTQVGAMIFGLTLLGAYMLWRWARSS